MLLKRDFCYRRSCWSGSPLYFQELQRLYDRAGRRTKVALKLNVMILDLMSSSRPLFSLVRFFSFFPVPFGFPSQLRGPLSSFWAFHLFFVIHPLQDHCSIKSNLYKTSGPREPLIMWRFCDCLKLRYFLGRMRLMPNNRFLLRPTSTLSSLTFPAPAHIRLAPFFIV